MKLLKSRPKQRMPEIPDEARKMVHRVGLALLLSASVARAETVPRRLKSAIPMSSRWLRALRIRVGSTVAPGSVSRFALNVPINSFPPVHAAEPKLNIEFGPGIGPSASTSVLT